MGAAKKIDESRLNDYNSHMIQSTISNSKSTFSSLIDQVRAGESVMITDRDVPVALLTPISRAQFQGAEILSDLERQGLLRRAAGAGAALFKDLPPETGLVGTLSALLAERHDGR
jgi:antitoxin (DNA-binding transcriptional repressor) of toxin-antitoxin stability system